jgi:septum formation protein
VAEIAVSQPQLVLASASPRRRELLAALGAVYSTIISDAEEHATPTPPDVAAALPPLPVPHDDHPTLRAWRKARDAAAQAPGAVVLGADTIVVLDDAVLNKPADEAHARAMLAALAGRTHRVYTGLCVLRGDELWLDVAAADVEFRPLSAGEIAAYVATGEPMDKAGAYGLQGLGGTMVRAVHGSYTCVVGFPLTPVHRLLGAAGVPGLSDPATTYERWLQSQGKELPPCPPTLP